MERSEELERKYSNLPAEIKNATRWVCFNKKDKIPMNALTGRCAKSNDKLTWTNFSTALKGCVKYHFDGLGFMLGEGVFGIDLDNHADEVTGEKPMSSEDFQIFANEFISNIDSYTERSQSGEGIHIICKGKLPEGARRKNGVSVEMYDTGRYFAMTGDIVNDCGIEERTNEVLPLWEKYLKSDEETTFTNNKTHNTITDFTFEENGSITFSEKEVIINETSSLTLSDSEIIEKIKNSRQGAEFVKLYNGDMTSYNNDHSAADLGLCTILAFWCNKNYLQIDRIFRTSALMRKKWDSYRGDRKYGEMTIEKASSTVIDTYTPPKEKPTITIIEDRPQLTQANKISAENNEQTESLINERGDVNRSKVECLVMGGNYTYDDTGNAERFYDRYGSYFKYNVDNKNFMFWNGKTWVNDVDGNVKKCADALISDLRDEANKKIENIKKAISKEQNEDVIDSLKADLKEMEKNITRISNKAGKDAMLSELQHIHDIPVHNNDFDTQDYLLNTDSGIVDLRTGEIMPFDSRKLLSRNTNCKVSYEEPTTFIKFLNDVFKRDNADDTKELVDYVQQALGYSLSGDTMQQCMFFLFGNGSNGKSTFVELIKKIAGDYGAATDSDLLMQNQGSSTQSTQFSLASLNGRRFVPTSETDEGKRLAEARIKKMTGSESIEAQFKYGAPFNFVPKFKIWMSTNNRPIIRGTDLGIWRRIHLIPFERTFTDKEKDLNMPKKLEAEMPKILGWIIQGYKILLSKPNGILVKPRCVEEATSDYRKDNDVVSSFISSECKDVPAAKIQARVLYNDYKQWCESNTEYKLSETKFGLEMVKKGYKKVRLANGWYYKGIVLQSDDDVMAFGSDDEEALE